MVFIAAASIHQLVWRAIFLVHSEGIRRRQSSGYGLRCHSDERVDVHLLLHHSVSLHELLDFLAFEGGNNGSLLLLDENSVESVLIADRVEDVQLGQAEPVPLAVLELLEEL